MCSSGYISKRGSRSDRSSVPLVPKSNCHRGDPTPNNLHAVGEQAALGLVDKDVRVLIICLSPTVHGTGDQGFMKHIARNASYPGYVGDGTNH